MEHFGQTCLSSCIRNKRFHQAKLLMELQCVDVNGKDRLEGKTALMETCLLEDQQRAVKVGKLLLRNGAEIGLPDKKGRNAFIYACKAGREKVAKLLIEEALHFDLNAADCYGNTALHYASLAGNLGVVKMIVNTLKRFKMSLDMINHKGETPLICAAKRGNILCIQFLVEQGKVATAIRDDVELKTAEEWQREAENNMHTESHPLRSYPESAKSADTRRSYTTPLRLGKDSSLTKSYRSDLHFLFQVYEKQVSGAFLPSVVKTRQVKKEYQVEGPCYTGRVRQRDLPLTVGPSGCQKLRLTPKKNPKTRIDAKDLCKGRPCAIPESSNVLFSLERAQIIAVASRFSSTKDRNAHQSARKVEKIGLSMKKCRNKFKTTSLQEENEVKAKESEEDGKTDKKDPHKSATEENKISMLEEEKFLSSNNDCDDEVDHDALSLSLPAVLFLS